jgi:FAD/FMN-containing dehydrogenase
MTQLIRHGPGNWSNYHDTVRIRPDEQFELVAGGREDPDPDDYLRETATLIKGLLQEAVAKFVDVRPLGGAWSFSELNKTDGSILQTLGSGMAFALKPEQLGPGAPADRRTLVLAAGGTRIGDLNGWLEQNGLSLKTSGASDGQSLAGAIATGTHGSVPSIGGIQNQVRAVQLVVSPSETVWVEPKGKAVLADTFLKRFNDRIVRDDALFGAAVVHLGGMGYVNAVVLEVAPMFMVEMVQQKVKIDQTWLADLEAGNFRAVAKRLGYDEDPYFYQVIINPFGPMKKKALHRLLLKRPAPAPDELAARGFIDITKLVDPLMLLAEIFDTLPMIRGPTIGLMMETLFKTMPKDPAHPVLQTWAETTPPHKNAGKLFSTGFAVPRERLRAALDAMFGAFKAAGGGDVVTTLRFVGKSAGTMAFTRFDNNVVIDFDGFRSDASRTVTQAAIAALTAAGIPFSRHWGKMAPITDAIVDHDYGAKVQAWRAARAALLPKEVQEVFASTALRDWGLA